MTAPTNLAEALDCLQAFMPTDRGVSIACYAPESGLHGAIYVHVTTGAFGSGQVDGGGRADRSTKLSDALFAAEADHAAKWNAKHGSTAAAEAEFGPYCPRLAA